MANQSAVEVGPNQQMRDRCASEECVPSRLDNASLTLHCHKYLPAFSACSGHLEMLAHRRYLRGLRGQCNVGRPSSLSHKYEPLRKDLYSKYLVVTVVVARAGPRLFGSTILLTARRHSVSPAADRKSPDTYIRTHLSALLTKKAPSANRITRSL